MEEKFFTSTNNFFKWVTEVADRGGLEILTLGTQGDTYWVTYQVKVIAVQPDVIKSVCRKCNIGDTNNDWGCTNPKCEMYPFK